MVASDILLAVNADDFGMSPAVSRGILRAHREGVVTSTSLLGNCEDLGQAREMLAEAPELGVGVHLTLLGGRPVADPATVRTLIGPDGAFLSRVQDLFMPLVRGRIDAAEIEHEFDAQVVRAREAGLALDHLDTHRHFGFFPAVGQAMEAVARRHRIAGIRSAVERPTLAWATDPRRGLEAGLLTGLAWLTRRRMGALRHGPQSWGYVESGRLDEIRILEIVGRFGPGAHELICHPGEEDDANDARHQRVQELEALTSPKVRRALERRNVKLCRWRDLF
jgi:chitin disaccharide deacetylase